MKSTNINEQLIPYTKRMVCNSKNNMVKFTIDIKKENRRELINRINK